MIETFLVGGVSAIIVFGTYSILGGKNSLILCVVICFIAIAISFFDGSRDVYSVSKNSQIKKEIKLGCVFGDCTNGKGEYKFSNGAVYKGSFKDNEFDGEGTYKFESGACYSGGWKNGTQDGRGIYTFPDGYQRTTLYKDGIDTCEKNYMLKIFKCPNPIETNFATC